MRFVDTNVLLYSISVLEPDQRKMSIAKNLLLARDLALSVQVLQEFYVQATRPSRSARVDPETAEGLVATFQRHTVQPLTADLVNAAIRTSRRFQLSYWDAAIVESARSARCATLLTEDLQHGQDLDGVVVTNPFL